MKLYMKVLIILSLLHLTAQTCSEGCLRCDTTNSKCVVCDNKRKYALDSTGSCFVKDIDGCQTLDANGGCFTCKSQYYYDANVKVCVKATAVVNNCRIMAGPDSCGTCVQGTYLVGKLCVKIATSLILNCVAYGSATQCTECRTDYILDIASVSCTKVNTATCTNYRNYKCNKCDTAHSLVNKNAYLIKPFDEQDGATLRNMMTWLGCGNTNVNVNSFCLATTVSNCLTFKSYNKCDTCESGYLLTADYRCVKPITSGLSGCKSFYDDKLCDDCLQGFYLDDSACIENTTVANCTSYFNTKDQCEVCADGYYVSQTGCNKRVNLDVNCKAYDPKHDNCMACIDGYAGHFASGSCIKLADNCMYGADPFDPASGCGKCMDGYYLDNGACVKGTIDNCKEYEDAANNCAFCADTYEYNGTACVQRTLSLPGCESYGYTTPTKCASCSNSSLLILQFNICQSQTAIMNCSSYSDISTCASCAKGYELVHNSCSLIPLEEHCLVKSLGSCTLCTDDHNLTEDGCQAVPAEILKNCGLPNSDSLGVQYHCDACAEGCVPMKGLQEGCVKASLTDVVLIDNCSKYTKTDGGYVCKQCRFDYVLSADTKSCVEKCGDDEVQYMGHLSDVDGVVGVINFAQCLKIADFNDLSNGCEVASANLSGDGNVCLQCKAGYIPIEQCSLDTTYFNIKNLSKMDEGQSYPVVNCVQAKAADVFVPTVASPDPNCLFYAPVGSKYYCKQCIFGKTGVVHAVDSGETYVECSEDIVGCNVEARYGTGFTDQSWVNDMYGIGFTTEFTCHSCTAQNEIPFIYLANDGSIKPFGTAGVDGIMANADSKDGHAVACKAPAAASLGANVTNFVQYCALGVVIVDQKDTATHSIVRCVACDNGYAPVMDAKGYFITACRPIDYCDLSSDGRWLNGCQSCSDGNVKHINSDGIIDPNNCSLTAEAPNCRIYDSENSVCLACERHYTLDSFNNCVQVNYPECSDFTMRVSVPHKIRAGEVNYSYVYYLGATGADCNVCSTDYISLHVDYNNDVCVQYPGLGQGEPEDNQYPHNCTAIGWNDAQEMLCHECGDGYVLSADNTQCFDDAELAGCHVANSATECSECSDNYFIKDTTCYEKKLDNCTSYDLDADNKVICLACNNATMVSNDVCVAGKIDNCDIYEDYHCKECKPGFVAYLGNCMPVPASMNCGAATISDVPCDNCLEQSHQLTCNTCFGGYFAVEVDVLINHTLCLAATPLPNCARYDTNFICFDCADGFYMKDSVCVPRLNIDDNCQDYQGISDACWHCKDGFYMKNGKCVRPLGVISNCRDYSNATTCVNCYRNMFLQNNSCAPVLSAGLIANCKYYSDAGTCAECESNSLLVGGSCQTKTALSCASYTNPNVCATCPPGMIFKVISPATVFTRDCAAPATPITDCYEVNALSKICKTCNVGFYLNSKKVCTQVTTAIANCDFYSAVNVCDVCSKGFIRSTDGKSCTANLAISGLEKLCTDLRYELQPACSACKPGYFFDSSGCTMCTANRPDEGCMYCNPVDNSKCLMCNSGYYMNGSGACVPTTSGIEAADQFEDYDEGVGATSAFAALAVLILALIR